MFQWAETTEWAPQAFTGGGGRTRAGRQRVCFQLQFDPARLDQYLEDHKAVWPEMQQALRSCGWHNYSLFYRPDGFAIGYFETDANFETACKRMDAQSVNRRWQSAMAKYTPAGLSPLVGAAELCHYFYLGTDVQDSSGAADLAGAVAAELKRPLTVALAVATFGLGAVCGLLVARGRTR